VESALLLRRAHRDPHPVRRAYLAFQGRLLERLESEWCGRVALNICVSREDVAALQRHAPRTPFVVVPNGADTEALRPVVAPPEVDVLGVGGLNWGPNREALDFLCREILPPLRRRRPEVRVRWVGRANEGERREFRDRFGVELTGYVPDVRPHLARAACVVAPLRAGGGTRLKILDAWAMQRPVVSTWIGAEGLLARDGENILLRDEAEGFADAVARVVTDPSLGEQLGRAARRTVESVYAWEVIGGPMLAAYRGLLVPEEAPELALR
jgi:glycosyltransferase involved in cell wall biosynthesis